MKRIVFLDYIRIFACFLVMLVHASENYYGAAGSTDMVGPQSYLLPKPTGCGYPSMTDFRGWQYLCL